MEKRRQIIVASIPPELHTSRESVSKQLHRFLSSIALYILHGSVEDITLAILNKSPLSTHHMLPLSSLIDEVGSITPLRTPQTFPQNGRSRSER